MEITEETKERLLSLSPLEIIDKNCEGTLIKLEEYLGMPIHIEVHRQNTTKEHQNFETSLYMSRIIVELKIIGRHYSKINSTSHVENLDYGLKLLLQDLTNAYAKDFLSREQYLGTKKLISEYILDELLDNVKKDFLIGYQDIPQYEMLFLLYEFCYRSPVHQIKYNFEGNDLRRTVLGRVELSTMNKYQDYKLNMNNIENQLFDAITNFTYSIKEIHNIIFEQKEVIYRVNILNEIYFNFEHFLSVIIKTFSMTDENMGKKKITKKQQYLARVFTELDIKHTIDFRVISTEIHKRCIESSSKFLSLLEQENKQTINLVDIFLKIVDMRNSLHSNGQANKDVGEFDIGHIHFNKVEKDKQFSSMAMHQLIILLLISSYSMELIIEKLSTLKKVNGVDIPKIIIDEYLEQRQHLIEK